MQIYNLYHTFYITKTEYMYMIPLPQLLYLTILYLIPHQKNVSPVHWITIVTWKHKYELESCRRCHILFVRSVNRLNAVEHHNVK